MLIMSVINDLSGDQRVHRIASTLQEAGHEVLVIGRRLPHSLPLTERPYRTHRMKLWFMQGKFFYLEFNIRLFFYLLGKKAEILLANDLDTLLANYLISRIKGSRLVYDTHEYFTEVPELVNRPATRAIWLRLERWLLPKAETVYTVNASLASIYSHTYDRPVGVIRNLPFRKIFPQSASDQNILIYQGALNLGRGIELMIDAMEFLPGMRLWIIGRGDLDEKLREQASARPWADRVVFKGFVPLENLAPITRQARIGLSLEEDLGANYHFASPNKVYDYVQAGLPVLVSDLPEMASLVKEEGIGEVLDNSERTPQALANKIMAMLSDHAGYDKYRGACRQAAEKLCWENEKETLIAIYNQGDKL